jgi:hypothetical protein
MSCSSGGWEGDIEVEIGVVGGPHVHPVVRGLRRPDGAGRGVAKQLELTFDFFDEFTGIRPTIVIPWKSARFIHGGGFWVVAEDGHRGRG